MSWLTAFLNSSSKRATSAALVSISLSLPIHFVQPTCLISRPPGTFNNMLEDQALGRAGWDRAHLVAGSVLEPAGLAGGLGGRCRGRAGHAPRGRGGRPVSRAHPGPGGGRR